MAKFMLKSAANENAALCIEGLSVAYSDKPAVFSVDAIVPQGAMFAIIGPNGAGKSTLLKASLGIIPKLSGTVSIFGKPVQHVRHQIAYVPQRASIDWDFPTRVIDVVLMGLFRKTGFFGWVKSSHKQAALEALDRVNMAEFANRQIGQLSGGQQQRVFLARALAQNAKLYLLDEPFAGVDAATEKAIVSVLKDLNSQGKTVVSVHHDLNTVEDYFDHALLINIRKIASGPLAVSFTDETLAATYGDGFSQLQLNPINAPAA